MKIVRNIVVAVAALHLLGCELVMLGWWRPPHVDGLMFLTMMSVIAAVMAAANVAIQNERS